MLKSNLKYHIAVILSIALLIAFASTLLATRKPKNDIKLSFHISGCSNLNGQLVVKGDVALKNNTDSPLFFGGRKLAENVDFVVVDNFFGKSHTANGNSMYSITSVDIENKKTYGLKVLPRSSSESNFLTSFDGELQGLDFKHIRCSIKIDGETYYSTTEPIRLTK